MRRRFDEVVADVAADAPPAPAPAPGDPPPVPAAVRDGRDDWGSAVPPSSLADDKVMHPVTGEVLELAEVEANRLAGYVATLGTFIADMTKWKRAAEEELRRRLGKDKVRVWGDWEVAAVSGRGRKWDPDDLEVAVGRLVDLGVLELADVADLITPGEPVVNGTLAARLLERVRAEHRPELEGCFVWERKGRATVRVTRSAELPAP